MRGSLFVIIVRLTGWIVNPKIAIKQVQKETPGRLLLKGSVPAVPHCSGAVNMVELIHRDKRKRKR